MNILLVIRRFDFGGAENHVCELANDLHRRGHKVIVTGRRGRQVKKLHPEIRFIHKSFRDYFLPLHVVWMVFLILRHGVELIHAHQRLPILISTLAGFFTRRKIVATVHGRARYDMRNYLVRRLAHRIVFVSKAVQCYAEKRYNIKHKTVYIPNGLVASDYPHDPVHYRICYASKISRNHYKFLEMMVDRVIPRLLGVYPHLEFVIIGDGRMMEDLVEMAYELNQRYRKTICTVEGYRSDLRSCYGSASLVMGVGRVALEASAGGVPVMLINGKRMGGMLTHKNYVTVKENNFIDVTARLPDEDAAYDLVTLFFENQEACRTMARELATHIREDFRMTEIVGQIEELYTTLK
ncbi:MAG: glycosyltransferase family 4 protein [Bacteroidota bacterium]